MMTCIRCQQPAGYNRVVLDLVTGTEYGGLCRNCEFDEFGHTLDRFSGTATECAVCDRDGTVAIATWEPSVDASDGVLVSRVEYAVTERTARLCDEHYHQIAADGTHRTARTERR